MSEFVLYGEALVHQLYQITLNKIVRVRMRLATIRWDRRNIWRREEGLTLQFKALIYHLILSIKIQIMFRWREFMIYFCKGKAHKDKKVLPLRPLRIKGLCKSTVTRQEEVVIHKPRFLKGMTVRAFIFKMALISIKGIQIEML